MNHRHLESTRMPAQGVVHHEPLSGLPPVGKDQIGAMPNAQGFVAMLGAYRPTGGIERAADLAWLMDDEATNGHDRLGRLVMSGQIFGFEWRDTFWVPMFQFDQRDMSVKPRPQEVRIALGQEFDRWGLAGWFAQSHASLNYMSPVDMIDPNLPAVLRVAHADRRLARHD